MGIREIIICPCGKMFEDYKYDKRKYCSNSCRSKFVNNGFKKNHPSFNKINPKKYIEKECETCNKIFKSLKSEHRRFCCKECLSIHISKTYRGKNSPHWKDIKLKNKFKCCSEWREWRKAVFERDNFTCQFCNIKGGLLEPHHLKSKQCFPELVYNVDNGITLCKKHHRLLHKLKPSSNHLKVEEFPINILQDASEETENE